MEVLGFLAIMLFLSIMGKFKRLQSKVKRLDKKVKGENQMSQLIQKMLNQVAKITFDSSFETAYTWTILEVDDDWVKLQRTDKKGKVFTKIVRLDDIKSIDIEE